PSAVWAARPPNRSATWRGGPRGAPPTCWPPGAPTPAAAPPEPPGRPPGARRGARTRSVSGPRCVRREGPPSADDGPGVTAREEGGEVALAVLLDGGGEPVGRQRVVDPAVHRTQHPDRGVVPSA